ncbi:ATP phosphoribosyltransferase regulatory subunit [Entomomonas sp. E2T0]|uniref:ATP phosphoribosyltransferase regulatory subunit n=1 Tax=Entomomonas sp. E2T0 TaxID=2930213 RepID=UPI00222852BA|nr:ATP phosphoribosyltransferase regulatory subunit [Entomomonas sp. E2T0]UYZ83476.1 ATP phosphoribosyltransferase regulatory subunit [Entomomonas sp. E2T0]
MTKLDRWLLPDGIEEVLPNEAACIETARRRILDLFECWGYDLVITPHVEYIDALLTGTAQDLDLQTFKTVDPLSGRLLGFRSDITPQVTRLDAHWLKEETPARLCYAGSILLTKPRAHTTSRSPIQLGAELYGDKSTASDIEIISLMLETLALAKVENIHMDLGHVAIFRGLAQASNLSNELENLLFDALQRKAIDEVCQLTADLPKTEAAMFCALTTLCGGEEVIANAKQVLANAPASVLKAIDKLAEIAKQITLRYPHITLYFDLGELRGYQYHTGIVFAAFVPNVGQSIAQGGRYDSAGIAFGRSRPATGFSTDLKTLVNLGQADFTNSKQAIWAPYENQPALCQKMAELRKQGQRVIQALPNQTLTEATEMGCDQYLVFIENSWQVKPIVAGK